ncbi:unnamed protein product [Polarella glacialis]|uniref:Secreted protein n=1 Tax=Polarella glacialis TaxID=89957 RepID=A0A813LN51_POLGL|nr:unnamed protein product [Polarella glacialis]
MCKSWFACCCWCCRRRCCRRCCCCCGCCFCRRRCCCCCYGCCCCCCRRRRSCSCCCCCCYSCCCCCCCCCCRLAPNSLCSDLYTRSARVVAFHELPYIVAVDGLGYFSVKPQATNKQQAAKAYQTQLIVCIRKLLNKSNR